MRLDQALVERGLVESRARAQALILAGAVLVGDRPAGKAGDLIAHDAPLTVRRPEHPYVGRGGLKLAHALDAFGLDPAGRVGLDIGASTGGFTDVLLRRGAARVYAVDVGRNQLDWRLRSDPRVVSLEQVNARVLTAAHVPEPVGAIVADVSFISLTIVLPPALVLAAPGAFLTVLVKPQFEAGREHVGKGGIVRDPEARAGALAKLVDFMAAQPGWDLIGTAESPITGADGNVEYLLGARLTG